MKYNRITCALNQTSKLPFVNIVSSSLILRRNFADGQSIPLLILDTRSYPEIDKSLELHAGLDNGKINFCWGHTFNAKIAILEIKCISPVEISYNILFNLNKDYTLLEAILKTHMFYIQAGKPGDRLSKDMTRPKLLIELGFSEYEGKLQKYIYQAKRRHFINAGIPKKEVNTAIKTFDKEWGKLINKRFK